jgi:hypothetical protein
MLAITQGKGFQITFPNGWTASVQFGTGNYCDNRSHEVFNGYHSCENAEIAAWRGERRINDVWHNFADGDHVKGWVKANEVLDFLNMVAAKDY